MKNTGTEQWIQTWKKWTCFLLIVLCAAMLDCGSLQAAKLPALKVKGTQLVNAKGKPVQLKGASTHGLSWFPEYVNQKSFSHLKKNWKANAVRLALYTSEYNGYCTGDAANRRALEKRVADGVKYATKAGLYVIIDWHILSDSNPNTHREEAKAFFREMSGKYKDCSHVLYEICNEPNGGTGWQDIKAYAQEVIGVIRENDADAVIMSIGTSPNPLIRTTTEGLQTNKRGCLIVKEDDGVTTTREGVFAGGDAVTGAATGILAMGAGKKAAKAIDDYLK